MSNLALLKTPAQLNLTGNPISFRIAGKNAFTGNLTKANCGIHITGSTPWAVDTYLKFTWGGKTVTFYCRTSPSDSLLEFPSLILYSELVAYLKKSEDLVADFDITYGVIAVIFTARKIGAQYNLVAASDWIPGFQQVGAPYVSEDHILADFYKIGLQIEKDSEMLAKIEFPVSDPADTDTLPGDFSATGTGIMETDISELLRETVNGSFTFPEPDSGFHTVHNLIKSFRVYAYEKLTDNIGLYSDDYRYMQGKLSNFRQGELNYLEKSIYDKLTESKMFLTWAPVEKITDIYAPERLYFLFTIAGFYKLHSKQYYSDGTTTDSNNEIVNPAAWDIYEFFVNYSKIRTDAPKKVIKYEISILDDNDDPVSEVRTFIIDYTYQQYARYFLLKNSFSVYELVRTTGKVVKSNNITKDIITIPLSNTFTDHDKAEKQVSADTETTYKINSGYLPDKYWAEWFMELLISEDIYWLKKGKAYPCTIRESKNQVSQDGDFNPYQEFDLTHSIHDDFTEEFTAHEPILVGDFNIDFNTDFFVGAVNIPDVKLLTDFSSWHVDENGHNVPDGWHLNPLPSDYSTFGIDDIDSTMKITILKDDNLKYCILNTDENWFEYGKKYRISFDIIDISTFYDTILLDVSIYLPISGNPEPVIIHAGDKKATAVKHYNYEGTCNTDPSAYGQISVWSPFSQSSPEDQWVIFDNYIIEEVA